VVESNKNSKPTIIFCNPSFLPVIGGIENWIFQIALRLIDRCNVYVITRLYNQAWQEYQVIQGINILRYTNNTRRIFLLRKISALFDTFKIIKAVQKILSSFNCSVFNFFDPRYEHVYALNFLKNYGVKNIICTAAGTMSETAGFRFKKKVIYKTDALVGISHYALRAFGIQHPKTYLFYPIGKKPADFERRRCYFDSRQVLTVCRIHPRKNLEFLIAVASKLPKLSFVVIGNYNRHFNYYSYLLSLIKKNKIKNVKFLGEKEQLFLDAAFCNSKIFFLPTHHEMFGLVFAEAMSYGLPVVAPNHTAIPEIVNFDSGYLYESNNLEEAVKAIQKITTSRSYWYDLSEGAKDSIEKLYKKDYIGQYAQMLYELAQKD